MIGLPVLHDPKTRRSIKLIGRRAVWGLATGAAMLGFQGCWQIPYVFGLAKGQADILTHTQSVEKTLEDPKLTPRARENLQELSEAMAFAKQNGFIIDAQYQSVARSGTEATVWVVVAAEVYEPKAVQWWFPIAGRVPYLGFFEKKDAQKKRDQLNAEGKEAIVRVARAYSTLGWFDDPIFEAQLQGDRSQFLETVFHEIFHATAYASGHSDWNESAAEFTAQRTLEAYLFQRGDGASLQEYAGAISDQQHFSALIRETFDQLEADYKQVGVANYLPIKAKRIETLKQRLSNDPWSQPRYQRWAELPWNHAHLIAFLPYAARFDRFAARWDTVQGNLLAWNNLMTQCAKEDDPWACVHPEVESHGVGIPSAVTQETK